MKEGFRQAMAWLHTWAGLIFGWLLFAIFLTGTLKDLPATYLTSFYLAPGHDQQIVDLSRAFPR